MSTIVTHRVGQLDDPDSIVGAGFPALVGGTVALLAGMGLQRMSVPANGAAMTETQKFIAKHYGILGIGAGGIAALGMGAFYDMPQATGTFAGALVVGLTMWIPRMMANNGSSNAVGNGYMFGAIVPQVAPVPHSTGAIAYSEQQGSPFQARGPAAGQVVSLGALNPSAFGTPGFSVAGG